jgi:hypothetical protein
MRVLAIVLAVFFFVLGILYGLDKVPGVGHGHPHVKHLIVLWILALLCLVWARVQRAPR